MKIDHDWLMAHDFRLEQVEGVDTYDYGGVILENHRDLGWRVSIDSEHIPDESVDNVVKLLTCMGRELPEVEA